MNLLRTYLPGHTPFRFGTSEPLANKFNVTDVDSILDSWGQVNFMAVRDHPALRLHVHFRPDRSSIRRHSSISLNQIESDRDEDAGRISEFLHAACEAFQPDLAAAHVLTAAEMKTRLDSLRLQPGVKPDLAVRAADGMRNRMQKEGYASVLWGITMTKLNTIELQKSLPSIYWLTVFGPPYVQLFTAERILRTPCYQTRQLSYGGIVVQLTASVKDNDQEWRTFELTRTRVKEHLDSNAFYSASRPKGHLYNVPDFGMPHPSLTNLRPMVSVAGKGSKQALRETLLKRTKRPN